MRCRRATSALCLVALFLPSVPVFAASEAPGATAPPSLNLRASARELRFDAAPASASPWKKTTAASPAPHHKRGLWIAIGAGAGAAAGAYVGAALQSLAESGESLTPSALIGAAVGGLGGALTAALITRK